MKKAYLTAAACTVFLLSGCVSTTGTFSELTTQALDEVYQNWVASGQLAASISNYVASAQSDPVVVAPGETPVTPEPAVSEADEAPFSQLKWVYGGFNGSGAEYSEGQPLIRSLTANKSTMYYAWAGPDLSRNARWGYSSGDPGAVACLFVQKADGSWVGGKFEWISTSRTSRGFENIYDGYNGWSLTGVPNPCKFAFVIVHPNGKQRSNTLVGTWQR